METRKRVEKRNPDAVRRAFRLVSGGDTQILAVFSLFDSYPWPGDSETSYQEDYDEMFGWKQEEMDYKNMMKSQRLGWCSRGIHLKELTSKSIHKLK